MYTSHGNDSFALDTPSSISLSRRYTGYLSLIVFVVQSILQPVYGQVVADPSAPKREQAVVLKSGNGLELVNIATPTAGGVSKNSYSRFDVSRRGVILNNSRKNVQSQLGGWTQGNPRLARGQARVILNQVNSSHPSHLNGYVEIAGGTAEFILANPSGIQVNGGGFINANRVTLSTGSVHINRQGGITHHITTGDISITGKGLDTSKASYTDILANAVQANAGIWAQNLSVVTGNNRIESTTGLHHSGNTQRTTNTAATRYALDVGKLGGMYAGKIHLIGTQAGLGVRNAGTLSATDKIQLDHQGIISNKGLIQGQNHTHLNSPTLNNQAGGVITADRMHLNTSGILSNRGVINAGKQTLLEADQVHNVGTGQIYGDHIAIAARYLLNDAETVQGSKKSAVLAARKRLDLGVHTLVNREGAELISGGDMAIGGALDNKQQATGSANIVQNRSARIEVQGDLNIKAHTLQNLNDHFATKLVQLAPKRKVGLLHNGKFYSEELVGRNFASLTLKHDEPRWRVLLPSAEYPLSKYPADITKPGSWASSKSKQTWEFGKNERNPFIISRYKYYRRGYCGRERCVEASISEYYPTHPIWKVFNITPPSQYSKPIYSGSCSDTSKPLFCSAQERARYEAYRKKLQAYSKAHSELQRKINAYNSSVRPRTLINWHVLNTHTTEYKPVVESTKPAQILVGGNLNTDISGRAVNDKSQIIVGKQANIRGKRFENIAAQVQGKAVTTGESFYSWYFKDKWYRDDNRLYKVTPLNKTAITNHTLAVSDYKVNQAPQFSGSGSAAADLSIKLLNSSLFSTIPSPSAGYLIETNSNFTNYRQWLSSDYLLKALSYDPARMHKRLGDGYYEQRLIQEQIAALTGRQFLGGHSNQDAQYQALMNAGATFAKKHNLRPGIALTPAQIQALSSDIVWLVNKEITLADGSRQTVLAPKVYVRSRKGDLDGTGTLISARDINLKLSGTLANTGTIAGRNIVSLRAKDINLGTDSVVRGKAVVAQAQQDLNVLGGSIQAQNHLNVGAGRDLNISSTTSTASDQGKTGASKYSHERLDRIAGLYVSKPAGILIASAGRDLNLTAAAINSQGAAALGAGRNLNLNTLNTHEKLEAVFDAHNHYKQNSSQDIGSHIQTAGSLQLQAGQDIHATTANINSQQGTLALQAGRDIHLKTGRQTDSLDVATRTTSRGFFSKKTTTTRTQKHNDYAVGNELGGKTVQLQAGRDATIEGSNVIGDTGTVIQTGRDMHITAGQNTHNNSHYHHVKKSGLMGSGGFGIFIGTKQTTNTADGAQTSHSASTVGSLRGDTTLVAGNNYKQTASNVLAPKGDITVLAKNIDVEAGHNTSRLHQTHKYEQKGLTVALNNPIIDTAQGIQGMAQAASKTNSGRMQALAGAAAGLNLYNTGKDIFGKQGGSDGQPPLQKATNLSVSVTYGKTKTSSSTTQTASSTSPSAIAAGGNVTLVAHNPDNNNPKQGNIHITGSRINSDKDIRLIADNDITLQAAKETSTEHSQHKSSSNSAGIKVSVGQETGISLIASASKGKGKGQGNGTQYTNTTVTAKNKLQLNSGKNTTLHGAVAKAHRIQADVGGDLHIESPQNTDHYHASSKSKGGSVSIGISTAPFGASISKSNTKINSHYQSTQNTSGLQAGDGGFDVNVKGNTSLIGGVISSTQAAIDKQRNQFNTGSLKLQNLNNQAAYEAKGSSITIGIGSMLGASAGIAQDSKKASSTTQSGISGIAGNAAVRTGDKDSGIAPIFNKQQVQDEIQAQTAITAAFGKQASTAWGNYATERQKKAQADLKQAEESQDPEAIAKAKKAANCWSSTGLCRAAGHAAIGGLTTGSAQGAVGGGLASITAPRINQALAKAKVKGPAAQALTTILTAAAGSAAGTAGTVAATNEVGNNYLYYWEDKIRRELQAKLARKEKEQCNTRQCQEEIASLKRQIKIYDDLDKKRDLDMIVACHTQGQKEACRDKVASAKAAILSFGGNQAGSREPGTIYAALRAVHGSRNYTPKVKSDPKQLAIMKLAGEIFIDLSPLGTPKDFYLAETPTDYLLAVLGAVPIGDLAKGGKYYRKWNEINKTLGGTLKSADEIAAAAAEGGHKHAGDIAGGIRRGGSAKNGGANAGAAKRGFGSTDAITVSGARAIDKAQSYENGVRSLYTGARFPDRQFSAIIDGKRVNGVADDVTIVGGKPTAVEAKFTESWATSPRNPKSSVANLPFAVAERNRMITQARNYSAGFRGGVVYHTNSTELATHYTRVFNEAGVTNFKFVITPTK